MFSLLLSALCLGLPLGHAHPSGTQVSGRPTVSLADGIVVGKASHTVSPPHLIVHQYLGVPFAESPPKRFAPPKDAAPWKRPLDASYFRASCIQYFPGNEFEAIFNNPPLSESEDCLYLNVFTPSVVPSGGLPVLFWIHGGSFSLGSARVPDYDGSSLAANQQVVVVTINYRLNVFGFPGSPAIPREEQNIGLMDQRKALSWVKKNIGAFGGDPAKVTIFGESAGGWSVKQLLINPPSPPQFRAAMLQSQAFGPQGDNERSWDVLVDELNCNNSGTALSRLECVAHAEADSIRSVVQSRGLSFTPVFDNSTNGPAFLDAVSRNLTAQVPILIGTNADEGTILASVMPPPELLLDGIFGNDTAAKKLARSAYPPNATAQDLKSMITTDYEYTCTTSIIARTAAGTGQRVWRYFFNASFPNNQPFPGAGAWHTAEIPLVFGTYKEYNKSPEQVKLSRTMQQAWGDFARSPELGPGWAAIGTATHDLRLFDAGEAVIGQSVDSKKVDGVCMHYNAQLVENSY